MLFVTILSYSLLYIHAIIFIDILLRTRTIYLTYFKENCEFVRSGIILKRYHCYRTFSEKFPENYGVLNNIYYAYNFCSPPTLVADKYVIKCKQCFLWWCFLFRFSWCSLGVHKTSDTYAYITVWTQQQTTKKTRISKWK